MTTLARKTMSGFMRLFIGMGAFLFIPAGTVHYIYGWIYLLVFSGSSALITFYLWKNDPELLARRVNAGPTAEKRKNQKVIQLCASLVFIWLIILPALDFRFSWSPVPVWAVALGDVLVALGFIIIFFVFRKNSFTAATIEVAPHQKVISTGPYAIIRHPMYGGALIMLIGTPLALGSWWGLGMIIPTTIILAWRLLDEEKFLHKNLAGYTEYCHKVRYHLIPGIW